MSADSWATCPRCKEKGDLGLRGQEFREDWSIGLNDDSWGPEEKDQEPCIIFRYLGECQRCGLRIKLENRFPLEDWRPVNRPSEPDHPKSWAWGKIPAGWWVRSVGDWWEVLATERSMDQQMVTLRNVKGQQGTWPRKVDGIVPACPGTAGAVLQGAVDALGSTFSVEVLHDAG